MKKLILVQVVNDTELKREGEFHSMEEADNFMSDLTQRAQYNRDLLGDWYLIPAIKITIKRD